MVGKLQNLDSIDIVQCLNLAVEMWLWLLRALTTCTANVFHNLGAHERKVAEEEVIYWTVQ